MVIAPFLKGTTSAGGRGTMRAGGGDPETRFSR